MGLMYLHRCMTLAPEKNFFQCGGYQTKGGTHCSAHYNREQVLDEIVLGRVQKMTAFAREKPEEFYAMATENGELKVTYRTEKLTAFVTALCNDFYTNNGCCVNTEFKEVALPSFTSGNAVFQFGMFRDASWTRDMEDDFGILPQPKFDEKQEEYLSFVNGAASVACVPKSLSEEQLEITGYMMEVLASSSYYMVTETLYEKVAKSKTARDPESAAMVDVIIRHKVFDFGYTHFHHKSLACASIVQTSLNSKSPSIVKNITKDEKATKKELKKILEAYGYD